MIDVSSAPALVVLLQIVYRNRKLRYLSRGVGMKCTQPNTMPKLTAQLLHAFIQRVEVYEKPTKYSRTEGNPVMIYYKYQLTPRENAKILFGEDLQTPDELESAEERDISIPA